MPLRRMMIRVLCVFAIAVFLVNVSGHYLIFDFSGDALRHDTHGSRFYYMNLVHIDYWGSGPDFWPEYIYVPFFMLAVGVFILATTLFGVVRPTWRILWPLSLCTFAVVGVSLGIVYHLFWKLIDVAPSPRLVYVKFGFGVVLLSGAVAFELATGLLSRLTRASVGT